MTLQQRLDAEVAKRDYACEISPANPDPMLIARIYQDEMISLICALFAYGNARLIVKFLESFDFELLTMSDEKITRALQKHYYRFQNAQDITVFFITLKRFKEECTLEEVFLQGYQKEQSVLDGLETLISKLWSYHEYDSRGYKFLLGNIPHTKSSSTYKRWNMFLRWMVRKDCIDMGLWEHVDKADLLIPLDTHTFKVSQSLGLLTRKSYDLKAVFELTKKLKSFDPHDPVKYDFALYRIGQQKQTITF